MSNRRRRAAGGQPGCRRRLTQARRGVRTPPNDHADRPVRGRLPGAAYSSINTGFTIWPGGYRTLANPGLDPEISDKLRARPALERRRHELERERLPQPLRRLHRVPDRRLQPAAQSGRVPEREPDRGRDRRRRVPARVAPGRQRPASRGLRPHRRPRHDRRDGRSAGFDRSQRGVLGLRYLADSARWGLDGSIRLVDDRDPDEGPRTVNTSRMATKSSTWSRSSPCPPT